MLPEMSSLDRTHIKQVMEAKRDNWMLPLLPQGPHQSLTFWHIFCVKSDFADQTKGKPSWKSGDGFTWSCSENLLGSMGKHTDIPYLYSQLQNIPCTAVTANLLAGCNMVRGSKCKKTRPEVRTREDGFGRLVKQETEKNVCVKVSFLP